MITNDNPDLTRPYFIGRGRHRTIGLCPADEARLLERLGAVAAPAATIERLPELVDRYGTGPELFAALAEPYPADPTAFDDLELLGRGRAVALVETSAGPSADWPTIVIPLAQPTWRERLEAAGVPAWLRAGSNRLTIAALRVARHQGV